MNITINDNLKKLRKEKGNTQEELAEHLNISMQAVSKWERGESYPDITLLPALAQYYNVTSDKLLGIEENDVNAKINQYMERSDKLIEAGIPSSDDKIAIWREAQKEFLNNHTVLYNLMGSLHRKRTESKNTENFDEIVRIGERLLNESTDNDLRAYTILLLCYASVDNEKFDIAKKYANMASNHSNCRELLHIRCLSGEECIEYGQLSIQNFIYSIDFHIIQDMYYHGDISVDEKIKLCEFTLNLYHLVYPDGDYWISAKFRVGDLYQKLTYCHLRLGNVDEALSCFEKMADNFVGFYTTDDSKPHTSFMVNRLENARYGMPDAYMKNEVASIVQDMEQNKLFDDVKNNERYIRAIQKLKNLY